MAIVIGLSANANAQTSFQPMEKDGKKMEMKTETKPDMKMEMNSEMKMKDGVMMMDNKMMMCSNEKCTPLTKPYKCTDGTMVAVNGTITKSDGSTSMLMNGSQISMDGKMTMIAHGQKGHMCTDSCPMHSKM